MKNLNLRHWRKLVGRTQCWLSIQTGIDRSKLSLFENGYAVPSVEQRVVIQEVLQRDMREKVSECAELSRCTLFSQTT
jgi:transcriptional regulator with XRE-family HTH domain